MNISKNPLTVEIELGTFGFPRINQAPQKVFYSAARNEACRGFHPYPRFFSLLSPGTNKRSSYISPMIMKIAKRKPELITTGDTAEQLIRIPGVLYLFSINRSAFGPVRLFHGFDPDQSEIKSPIQPVF
jgi:hypothetical protein